MVMILLLLVKIRLIIRAKKHGAQERKVCLIAICWATITQRELIFSRLISEENDHFRKF
jgi:hypothetical protein